MGKPLGSGIGYMRSETMEKERDEHSKDCYFKE